LAFLTVLFKILKIVWVSFPVSVAIQIHAVGNKPEEDHSCFEKKSAALIRSVFATVA